MPAKRAKLFKNGRSQAVRIPKEFEFEGSEVLVRRLGRGLILEPTPGDSLLEWLATKEPLVEEFPEIDDPPPEPVDL
ncbi:MAG: antitoxin [Terriglobales bacterium]